MALGYAPLRRIRCDVISRLTEARYEMVFIGFIPRLTGGSYVRYYRYASLNDGDTFREMRVRRFRHLENVRMYLHKPK